MEYQVPQFIDVEDKVIGPLTLKQFIFIAGGAGICILFFFYIPYKAIAFLLSALVAGFSLTLAFYKVNGKSFVEILEAGFNYYTGAKFFLWKNGGHDVSMKDAAAAAAAEAKAAAAAASFPQMVRSTGKLTRSKLSDLASSLDAQSNRLPDSVKMMEKMTRMPTP